MFSSIKIKNFMSCKSVTLENLGYINIILGSNNSGKSSILKGTNLFTEAANTGQLGPFNDVNQYHVSLPLFEDIIFKKDDSKDISITYTFKMDDVLSEYYNELDKISEFKNFNYEEIKYRLSLNKDMRISKSLYDKDENNIFTIVDQIIKFSTIEQEYSVQQKNSIMYNMIEVPRRIGFLFTSILDYINDKLKGIYFISVDRRPRLWKTEPRKWDRITPNGSNVVSLLSYLRNSTKQEDENLYLEICSAISRIAPDIVSTKTPMAPDGRVSITHIIDGLDIDINALTSGTGINQTIPLIVQLMYAKKGEVILIEEPEISLFPDSQEILAEIMIKEAQKGKQILCTTHSYSIPMRFWVALGKQNIPTDFIKSYIVEKNAGETTVKNVTLEESIDVIFHPPDYYPK